MSSDDGDLRPDGEETLFELIEAAQYEQGGDEEDEFSLEQLGAAYARVMRGETTPDSEQESGPETVATGDGNIPGPTADSSATLDPPEALDDSADDRACPVTEESVLEAVLFVGTPVGTRLTARKLASLMREVSPREIQAIVDRMNARYSQEQAAYRIVLVDGGYQMELIPELDPLRNGFLGEVREFRLPQSAVDVLAIVAYHQPLNRQSIEQYCLRPCGAVLGNLVQRKLLEQVGEGSPRDRNYVTTARFLELLGLESLHDLPLTSDLADLPDS